MNRLRAVVATVLFGIGISMAMAAGAAAGVALFVAWLVNG